MANTHAQAAKIIGTGALIKSYETSGSNTAVTVSTPTTRGRALKLLAVFVAYSTTVSKNVTVTFNAGHGSAFDALMTTIALSSAADGVWLPDSEIIISPAGGDAIDVLAPAGGSGETASVTILTREM